ncbi:MAG: ABC transporter ATP-binding protein [Candidatus Infernicultor aquiphilus]|uniref:ABC transporter ATP-binding protein n=2 Tax=Candidatus Infernicultor aquiphilus TaxID=1805029 RepID=A0A2M7PN85_9BACT|nr:MAG: ABC transporter ATP-binding protein [Candidatus Atribacteria bacterium CG17_big_fil_post_rev_8_21_14_2_50_34_11]PIY31812.1 MAG: ABC transporter ATP-binding protein [Candidatus Atribacteria bacterium CG_4_10_14_3_um_filter_34_13]PJB56095.1 MAG: ABC transporter ATP-binding protein [Candidatus Atribacteria bacterium CG_4_9_14_3_um_filter_33_16]
MLKVHNLEVSYGPIRALKGISFEVKEGEIVTLIGANGAGKSTTLRTISNLLKPQGGSITFLNEDLLSVPAYDLVKRGIIHVPEGRIIFGPLTVQENLELATWGRKDKIAIQEDLEKVYDLFPILKGRRHQLGETLSGGEQQMLALGRGLMARAKLMLLDEPSMGLAPLLVQDIFRVIRQANAEGTTILLVEQNAHMALEIAHRAYVLETGNIILEGPTSEVAKNPKVIKAYLG